MGVGMRTSTDAAVVILGAGLTGLSAAYHLRARPPLLLEREQRVGGKVRSRRREGHTFDITGHWLHVPDGPVREVVRGLFGPGDLVEIERRTGVFTHGVMLPYPFQANLHGLSLEIVQECLVGFVQAREDQAREDRPSPRTFQEYAVARFGSGIARHFFVPYNQKLWGTDLADLTPDRVKRYVPEPEVAQIIGGALGLRQEGLGYNAKFLYPAAGGIDALPEAFRLGLDPASLQLGTSMEEIDVDGRRLRAGGQWMDYSLLVSTLPLPELVRRIPAAPEAVRTAAGRLRSIDWRYLDVATKSATPMDEHWVYVPEPDLPFFRVGSYSNALAAMAPPGGGSLYVELADREGAVDLNRVLLGLSRVGAIAEPDDVRFVDEHTIEHAYVVFDGAWEAATGTILSWLERVGIRSCGRYGAWVYNSMGDSIQQGIDAAAWVEERVP